MKIKDKQSDQTPKGVLLQGSLLMCLAVAMVIAGGTVAYMQLQGSESVDQPQQSEVIQNENTEDTSEPTAIDSSVPAVHSSSSGSTPHSLAEEAVAATAVPQEPYCRLVMTGDLNSFSEESTPDNTAWLSADLCAGILLALSEYYHLGILSSDDYIEPLALK